MNYGKLHRYFLRSVASQGVMSVAEAENLLNAVPGYQDEAIPIADLVKVINNQIKPFQQTIKITNDELTNEVVLVFLSLGFDDASKAQNIFNATELEFFRILIEQIMTTEARQITGIQAINLVGGMKSSFTKTDAQRLLNIWCKMRYLDKDQNNYALGVRAINEFEGYLRQNMPETIEECSLCKQIVFRGYNCPFCAVAIHTRCLNKYLEKVEKWPCCKVDFATSHLERLHSGENSRLSQTLQTTQLFDDASTEVEQTQESTEEMQGTQDIIPEISQRVSKKRKRQCD
ncbi:hypothetical protein ACJJTC_019867 [Scirpophaga incertulas]